MSKTILITGATAGIGLETARRLVRAGHHVILHGRNSRKLRQLQGSLSESGVAVDCEVGGLSRMADVVALARSIAEHHPSIDVLINNAGVYQAAKNETADGLDIRFAVNTIAPFLLTQRLLPQLSEAARVINVSSAAQSSVDLQALSGPPKLSDGPAYAQSKLALVMWSNHLAALSGGDGPTIVSVNPGSMLATKMVVDAFGVAGRDIQIGAKILERAAIDGVFAKASGKYYDNDAGRFAPAHPDAAHPEKCEAVVQAIDGVLARVA